VGLVGDKVAMKRVSLGVNFDIVIPFCLLIDIFISLSERHNTLNTTHSEYSYTYVDVVILYDKGRNKLPKHAVVNTGVHSVVIDPIISADIDFLGIFRFPPATLSFHHPFTQLSATI
jgi:hypothetical protein